MISGILQFYAFTQLLCTPMLLQIPRLNYTVEPHRMRSHEPRNHYRRKAISSILAYVSAKLRRKMASKSMQKNVFSMTACWTPLSRQVGCLERGNLRKSGRLDACKIDNAEDNSKSNSKENVKDNSENNAKDNTRGNARDNAKDNLKTTPKAMRKTILKAIQKTILKAMLKTMLKAMLKTVQKKKHRQW